MELFPNKSIFITVQFSHSVVSDSLWPHRLQHTRLSCPSPTPGAYSNLRPSRWWCHQPSHPLSSPSPPTFIFPSIRVFSKSQFFASGGQSIGASASASVLPMNIQNWFPLGWISLQFFRMDLLAVQGTLKSLLQHHSSKASVLRCSAFFMVQLSHPYMATGKTIALTRWTFVGKIMSLFFNMLSRFVIAFLPRRKRHGFMVAVTICSDFGAPQNKVSVSIVSPFIYPYQKFFFFLNNECSFWKRGLYISVIFLFFQIIHVFSITLRFC